MEPISVSDMSVAEISRLAYLTRKLDLKERELALRERELDLNERLLAWKQESEQRHEEHMREADAALSRLHDSLLGDADDMPSVMGRRPGRA
jgi:hypothetical protein